MTCSVKQEIEKELDAASIQKINGVYQVTVPANSNKLSVFLKLHSDIRPINKKYNLPNVSDPIHLDKDKFPNAIAVVISPHQALEDAYKVRQQKATVAQVNSNVRPPRAKPAPKVKIYPKAIDEIDPEIIKSHAALLAWKEGQLETIRKNVANLEKSLIGKEGSKHHADVEKNEKLKSLLKEKDNLQKAVSMLKKTEQYSMFSAIASDLKNMLGSIESGDFHNIAVISKQLEFYKSMKFINKTGTDDLSKKDNDAMKEIRDRLGLLDQAFITGSQKAIEKLMSDDALIKGTMESLNKDIELRRRFGTRLKEGAKGTFDTVEEFNKAVADLFEKEKSKILKKSGKKRLSTKEATALEKQVKRKLADINDYGEFVVADLLKVTQDINWVDSNTLGMISSNRGDTILPQFVYSLFLNHITQNENFVIDKINKLTAFNKKNKGLDRSPLFNLDESGEPDGDLVDAFSNLWYEFRQESFGSLVQTLWYAPTGESDQAYHDIIDWLNGSADVLNLYKLPETHSLYGGLAEHQDEFNKYSAAERNAYKAELKERLGPQYEIELNKVKNAIAKYQRTSAFEQDTPKNTASSNIWEFTKLYEKGSNNKIEFIDSNGKKDATYFTAFHDLPFIPKKALADFNNSAFKVVTNSKELTELWDIYRDMGEYIHNTYSQASYHKVRLPKVENTWADKFLKNIKKGNLLSIGADTLGEVQDFFFNKNNFRTKEGIISNYKDRAGQGINEFEEIYRMKGVANPRAEAVKKVNELYYSNLDTSFIAVLRAAALHQTRQEMEPVAKMIAEIYSRVKTEDGKQRFQGQSKMDYFVSHVVLNQPGLAKGGVLNTEWKKSAVHRLAAGMLESLRSTPTVVEKADELKAYSDMDNALMKEIQIVAKKGAPDEMSVDSTIDGVKYILISESNGEDMVYRTNIKISPITGQPDESGINDEAEVVSKEVFNNAFGYYLDQKMKSLGSGITLDSAINGWLTLKVIAGLGFKVISGLNNRMEGMLTNFIADQAGEQWTKGNYAVSKNFFAYANLLGVRDSILIHLFGEERAGKMVNLARQQRIFRALMPRMGALQDKFDTMQKSAEGSSLRRGLLKSIYAISVEHPEYKNQGEIHTNIMQDTVITDSEGNEYKFFDRNTMSFPALMIKDGILVVKPEFKVTPKGGFSFDSKTMEIMVNKITVAVARKQGNYATYDIAKIKRNALGKSVALFHTYLPEKLQAEVGELLGKRKDELIVDLANQQEKRPGYKSVLFQKSPSTLAAYALTNLGLSYGALHGVVSFAAMGTWLSAGAAAAAAITATPFAVAGIIGVAAFIKMAGGMVTKQELKSDGAGIINLCLFLETMLKGLWNYNVNVGSSALNIRNKNISKGLTIERGVFNESASNMTKEELGALRATATELGARMSMFLWKAAIVMFLYDDDDDEKSRKGREFNTASNAATNIIKMSGVIVNPVSLGQELAQFGILQELSVISNSVRYAITDDKEKVLDEAIKLSVVPKSALLSYYLQTYNLDKMSHTNWMTELKTEYDTKGKSLDKKAYEAGRADKREEVKDQYRGFVSSKDVLSKIADNVTTDQYLNLKTLAKITKDKNGVYRDAIDLKKALTESFGENYSLSELRLAPNAKAGLFKSIAENIFVDSVDKDGKKFKMDLYGNPIEKGDYGKYITVDDFLKIVEIRFPEKE